jgi:glucose dehydrogenase
MGETMRQTVWVLGIAAIAMSAGVADAKTIKVFNPTHYAMVSLQAKKPAAKDWDADMLGKTALGVGKVKEIDLDTTDCHYDLRATFDDGHQVEKKNVDMCGTDVLPFTDE